jgi:hypothetical protein
MSRNGSLLAKRAHPSYTHLAAHQAQNRDFGPKNLDEATTFC